MDLARGSPDHKFFVEAVEKAKLADTLSGIGSKEQKYLTVFAPTDKALTNALRHLRLTKQQFLDKANLADIMKYHVLPGYRMSSDFNATQSLATVSGAAVTVTKSGSTVKFSDATVNPADLVASNGVLHVICWNDCGPLALPGLVPARKVVVPSTSHCTPLVRSALACAIVMGIAVFRV
jgi:uncharacterized surface protein with fasciclin (FAS1) repeats